MGRSPADVWARPVQFLALIAALSALEIFEGGWARHLAEESSPSPAQVQRGRKPQVPHSLRFPPLDGGMEQYHGVTSGPLLKDFGAADPSQSGNRRGPQRRQLDIFQGEGEERTSGVPRNGDAHMGCRRNSRSGPFGGNGDSDYSVPGKVLMCSSVRSATECGTSSVNEEPCFWFNNTCNHCGNMSISTCPQMYCRSDPDQVMQCVSYARVCHLATSERACRGWQGCYFVGGTCHWCGELVSREECDEVSECMWLSSGCRLQNTTFITTLPPKNFPLSSSEVVIVVVCSFIGLSIMVLALAVCSAVYQSIRRKRLQRSKSGQSPPPDGALTDDDAVGDGYHDAPTSIDKRQALLEPRTEEAFHRHCMNVIRTTNGAFQKTRLIGRGACGSVYAAMLPDGTIVAVKEVLLKSADVCDELLAEVRLTLELRHPNIVRVYGFRFDDQEMRLLIFMELVSNGSVGSLVRTMDGPLPECIARTYVRQLTSALAYTHSKGVVHRDLKCDNLLLTQDGALKLADFGASKQIGLGTTAVSNRALTMVGTPFFMAPEILLAEADSEFESGYGKRADVWSLGITVLEMLSQGVPPWPAQNTGSVILLIASPDGSPHIPERLSIPCADFVKRCLVRDPRKRSTSAELCEHPWLHTTDEPIPTDLGSC